MSTHAIEGGAAVEFTSPQAAQVDELRRQVREAARAFEAQSRAGQSRYRHKDESRQSPGKTDGIRSIPPIQVAVKNIDAGARVLVHAVRSEHVDQVRKLATALETYWAKSDCARQDSGQSPPQARE